MGEKTKDTLAQIYTRHLKTINQINFTDREIEVIAFLLHIKGIKSIAQQLSIATKTIAPKTVEGHLRNICSKINCNSQNGIIKFIENSGKLEIIREFYTNIIQPVDPQTNPEIASQPGDDTPDLSPTPPARPKTPLDSLIKTLKNLVPWFSAEHSQKTYIFGFLALTTFCLLLIIPFHYYTYKEELPVRSDLIVPLDVVLLQRSDLLDKIDRKFKQHPGIQSVALIGPGGAGKTTIARQYVQHQSASTVWDINAETQGSLYASFENLAAVLSKTEEDKRELAQIQEMRDERKRQDKLIQFVKNHLRVLPNWFLIFDNVEQFAEIQAYFPQDANTWGQGKIILTTRDKNIESHSQINHVLLVEELDPAQKLDLFSKILNHGMPQPFTESQREEAKQFLENIPSFPLDVSTAAHYLKATHIPYQKYLENLGHYHQDFANVQEQLLKEVGPYVKTRYGIITLSLEQLIEKNKDFADLLLSISLLDSQNIPSNLLKTYKNNTIVDSFIHNLKKYSLITQGSSDLEPTFSIHRSTQGIMLAYLNKIMDLETNRIAIKAISNTLEQTLDDAIEQDDIKKMLSLYGHITTFLNHLTLIPEEDQVQLLSTLGYLESYVFKNNIKAKENMENSYSMASKYYKKEDLRLAKILVYLGIVYRKLAEYDKGREFLEKGFSIYRNHFPENHPQMGWVFTNLGHVYRSLGDCKKAKDMLEKALENYKINIPQNKSEYVRTIISLGVNYNDMGEYKKSAELLNQSLETHKKYFAESHPNMTFILGYLGEAYRTLGEFEKAKNILEKGFVLQKKYFPYSSNENNWFMYLLGKVYSALGEYEKSKTFLEASLAYSEKNYGKDHVETAHVIRCLGENYYLEGTLDLAENQFQTALIIFQKSNHLDQYMVLEDLAEINLKKSVQEERNGNLELSQKFKESSIHNLEEALKIVKIHFPEDSPHIERIKSKLSTIQ